MRYKKWLTFKESVQDLINQVGDIKDHQYEGFIKHIIKVLQSNIDIDEKFVKIVRMAIENGNPKIMEAVKGFITDYLDYIKTNPALIDVISKVPEFRQILNPTAQGNLF